MYELDDAHNDCGCDHVVYIDYHDAKLDYHYNDISPAVDDKH